MIRAPVKIGLIVGGYVAAFLIASAVVAIRVAATSDAAAQASSGMYAFGDSVLFLAVFTVCALPPTGAMLISLRSRPGVWNALSVGSLTIAATAIASALAFQLGRGGEAGSFLRTWAELSPLRMIVAPLLALVFGVAGLAAPSRRARIALFAAAASETLAFAVLVGVMMSSR